MEHGTFVSAFKIYVALLTFKSTSASTSLSKLILISMDGFRYDYLDLVPPNEAEHFRYMIKNGVKAKSIMNVFPTATYPNHYTMITGLYPESHGIVHNLFLDTHWNEYFVYDDRRDNVDPFWYDVGAEPIYVTNKKAGGSSGSVVWPAGIGEVKGIKPDRLVPDANSFTEMNSTERVDTLIKWFTDKNNPINLGLLYFLEPDETAHASGAGSKNVTDLIKGDLNGALGYLFQRLKENNLFDEMNIILTADHGFVNYTKDKAVLLNNYLNSSWYKTGAEDFRKNGNRISVNIFPEDGQEENILKALRNVKYLKVYKKGDSDLVSLHYNSSDRIAPVVITGSEEGVTIYPTEADRDFHTTGLVGVHGYNPHLVPDMRPFFVAMGPTFKKDYVSEHFNSVDIYPLMCSILGIEPAPNNGSFGNVKGILREKSITDKLSVTGITFLVIVGLSVTLAGIYAICVCHNARNNRRFMLHGNNRRSGVVTSLRSPTHHLLNSDDEDDEF
ncbi:ectonucleotide pyrophosphatase/phosphodiesterase family member 5-like [Mercenaria mercenaria]|uniref:ectonucleotide pyrophosphatase/phosphodiesterase family member 5-like n=1 Tax=Mercenaria mercenaria TaxID=6596 RepID=UPI00234E5AD4|nr:ectonucleotide pyrophosphatase/phosphodiesterase family member 5-like [Mercenaria mercenaria]